MIWMITVAASAALFCSSQVARATCEDVNMQDTPIQVMTAYPFQPLSFSFTPKRQVGTVANEAVMFRESPHNTPYPAVIILKQGRYNRSSYFDVSVFDIRNIAAKTWQPFQREIDLEQVLGIACSEIRWHPALTTSPSKEHIVMYGFGTGQCAEKLVIYGDRRSRVITATGGHAAMGAALAALAVGEADNSTFDLFAFGGAECLEEKNDRCQVFTSSLRRLHVQSSEACVNYSWQKWEVVEMSRSKQVPTPRVHAHLFADGDSLLLFGGVTEPSSGQSDMAPYIPDFWTFSFVTEQWAQLESNLSFTGSADSYPYPQKTVHTAYISGAGTMLVARGGSLYLCSVSRLAVSCRKYMHELLGYLHYLSAGHSYFYLVSSMDGTERSFKMEVLMSGAGEGETMRVFVTPQIEQDIGDRCPAFQGHRAIPAIFVPHRDQRNHQYLFFVPAYIDSPDELLWRVNPNRPQTTSIWAVQHGSLHDKPTSFVYTHTFNSPAPASCSSVTYLNPSTALACEFRPAAHVWCLSTRSYSWTRACTDSSLIPPYRTAHVTYRHRSMGIVLYGGLDGHDVVLRDLLLFQLHEGTNCTGSWRNLTSHVIEGHLPRRYRHSVTEYGDDVLIFGGLHRLGILSIGDLGKSVMFMLQIKSNDQVVVRNIEIIPPIQSRLDHTLSWYTKNDLLLLGGILYQDEDIESAQDALLMSLEENKNTIVAKWTVFFRFRTMEHSVLNNRIFSGRDSAGTTTRQFHVIKNTNQCPKGYARDLEESCRPCPVGYYSASIEQQCEKCGNLTTTTSEGSTTCEPRNPCLGGYCHGHGTCFVNKADYKPFCTCQFGYVASDRCKVPSVYLALMAAVVFATTATILVIALYQFIRKRRALYATEIQLGHTFRDLQRHQKKLHRINRGALVRWTDLKIRKQLASGTYSKVLQAEMGDMTVAVKQFPSYFTTGSLSSPYDFFVQEAEILRGLRHPNIVMFIGAGRDAVSGCPFLVMEYLRRGSLHDVLHDLSNPIEHSHRLRFALDAARGLKYLHSSSPSQIHRDIKSPNLLVSDKWVVKVGDLETARFLATCKGNMSNGGKSNTKADCPLGDTGGRTRQHSVSYNSGSNQLTTPLLANDPQSGNTAGEVTLTSRVGMTCGAGTDRWRSPESIQKNLYTEKHDVYSFGVVLWEIFTRQTPYSDVTRPEAILDEIVNERKPIFPASAPYAYRHLAEQCMKTDAVDRPTIQRVVRELIEQFETF